MAVAGLVYALIDAVGLFVPSGIANAAHLAGLAVGIAAAVLLKSDYGELSAPESSRPKVSEEKLRSWEDRWLIGKKA
jgi:hypothetical protein